MIRVFFRHVWDSLKNLKRNGWMTVAAVSSVMITLVLVGIFLSLILNTTKLADDLERNVRVVSYMKLNVHDQQTEIADPDKEGSKIANPDYQKVYNQISEIENVSSVEFSSKEEQLKNLTESLGDVWTLYQGDANPLYDAYIVKVNEPENVAQVTEAITQLDGIYDANNGGTNTEQIFALSKTIRTWGTVIAGLLIFIAVFLISNTIRITIISRSREIQIMRLVGAKNGYIRWPFFLEGAWVGLVGSILPILGIFFVYRIAYIGFQPALTTNELYLYEPMKFIPLMAAVLAALGIIIGSLGATISMRRYLKA